MDPIRKGEIEAIRKYIQGNVVDVGCGSNKVYTPSVGIDQYSQGQAVYGKPEWNSIADWHANASDLPFKDKTVDTLIAFHVIEHIVDACNALQEWLRVKNDKGHVCLIVPDTRWTFGKDATHVHEWIPETFKAEVLDKMMVEPIQFDTLNNNWSFDCVL